MTEEEILFFRPVHWLIQFLWNYRFYYDLLKYLQQLNINPLDYIVKLINDAPKKASPTVKELFQQFEKEAQDEWYDSPEQLREHYNKPGHFQWLVEGNYGKMNSKYIFKTVLELKDEFEEYLLQIAVDMAPAHQKIFIDILSYLSTAIIDFSQEETGYLKAKTLNSHHDILTWKNNKYTDNLEDLYNQEGYTYEFSLPSDQLQSLKTLLKQYAHKNKNVTLRKMSEFMEIRDFFRTIHLVQLA